MCLCVCVCLEKFSNFIALLESRYVYDSLAKQSREGLSRSHGINLLIKTNENNMNYGQTEVAANKG